MAGVACLLFGWIAAAMMMRSRLPTPGRPRVTVVAADGQLIMMIIAMMMVAAATLSGYLKRLRIVCFSSKCHLGLPATSPELPLGMKMQCGCVGCARSCCFAAVTELAWRFA